MKNFTNNSEKQQLVVLNPANAKKILKNYHQDYDIYVYHGDACIANCQDLDIFICSKVPIVEKEFLDALKKGQVEISKNGKVVINGVDDSWIFDKKVVDIRAASAFDHPRSYDLTYGIKDVNFINENKLLSILNQKGAFQFKKGAFQIENPLELFLIIFKIRSFNKCLVMHTTYGAGKSDRLKELRNILLANEKKIREKLRFKNFEGETVYLKDCPYLGFTEQTLENITIQIDQTIHNLFPDIMMLLRMTKNIGNLCYLHAKPVLYLHFSPLGGFIRNYAIPKQVVRKINKKKTVIFADNKFKLNYDLVFTEVPEGSVNQNISTPACFIHHIDVGIILEVAKIRNLYIIHDAEASLVSYLPLVQLLYINALNKLQKSNSLEKFAISNLKFICPNIQEILEQINKKGGRINYEKIIFQHTVDSTDDKKVIPARVVQCGSVEIDGVGVLNQVFDISNKKKKYKFPKGLKIHCLCGIFDGYDIKNKDFSELKKKTNTKLDTFFITLLDELESFLKEYVTFVKYVKKQKEFLVLKGPGMI